MSKRGWEAWEHYVTHLLGIDATIHSGNKFYDPGDAVTRGRSSAFPLYADAKYTEKFSYPLKLKELSQYGERAADLGKRLVLSIRFWPKGVVRPEDYVVLSADDFVELLDMAKSHEG